MPGCCMIECYSGAYPGEDDKMIFIGAPCHTQALNGSGATAVVCMLDITKPIVAMQPYAAS